jgi:hypothetical protein
MKKYTLWCPNCDAALPARLWDNMDWECGECGESGTFTARPDTMMNTLRHKHVDDLCRWAEMTAAQIIAEVGVQKYLEIAKEIAEMYQPTPDNDLPF